MVMLNNQRIPNGHQKDTKKTPQKKTPHLLSRSSRSVEACQDPLECGTEFGADISTNVIWRYLNIDGSQNFSHGLHNLHMCPANNLDRFKGRKDDKDVLTHSLHVAYAAEDVPYATVVWLTRILNAWWLHMGSKSCSWGASHSQSTVQVCREQKLI